MRRTISILSVILFIIATLFCGCAEESINVLYNINGTLDGNSCKIIYAETDNKYNTLYLTETDTINQELIADTGEVAKTYIADKKDLSALCDKYGVKSTKKLYEILGQPVYCDDNYLIFDSRFTGKDVFAVFDLIDYTKTEIVKTVENEILMSANLTETGLQLLTDYGIYSISEDDIAASEYVFNNDIIVDKYDFVDTDMFNYIHTEDYSLYTIYGYTFNDSNEIECTDVIFNLYSYVDDEWYINIVENTIVLDYYIEKDKLMVVSAKEEESSNLTISEWNLSYSGDWSLANKHEINLPVSVRHIQNNCVANTEDVIICYPYGVDDNKVHIFMIDKKTYTIRFSADMNDDTAIQRISTVKQ